MATLIAVACVLSILVACGLVFIAPATVFYLLLVSTLFGNVFGGYVYAAGNLGMPRAWQPADALAWLTLLGVFLVRKPAMAWTGVIGKCMTIIAILAGLSLVQGVLLYPSMALTHSRGLHFIPAMLFARRYLSTPERVRTFLRFCAGLLLVMFVSHVLLRTGLFVPPVAQEVRFGQLAGERGELSLVMVVYLVLLSVGLGRLSAKTGSRVYSTVMILAGLAGIALSETRTLMGAVVVLGGFSMLFVQGRVKNAVIYSMAICIAVAVVDRMGLDLTRRFRDRYGRGEIVNPLDTGPTWRTLEYTLWPSVALREPYFVLTGRGIGAIHSMPASPLGEVAYYHSEFLGWVDRFGLIGLACLVLAWTACLWRGFRLARSALPEARLYGSIAFLFLISVLPHSVFSPSFMNSRGSPLLICFVVLMCNVYDILQTAYESRASVASEGEPYRSVTGVSYA